MAKRLQREMIIIRGVESVKEVSAIIVGKRVAVHQAFDGEGFTISDPLTGRAYWWDQYGTEASALRKARAFVREFGTNPLRGFKMRGEVVIRKPPRVAEMRAFFGR